MAKNLIWLRRESRVTERRTPLLPEGAKDLIRKGYRVVVEKSKKRIIADAEYAAAGCRMVAGDAWLQAPKDAIILGLKELPEAPAQLPNTHIYFGHAYKQQSGWQELLSRFTSGGGELLDLEYLVTEDGKRVVAFGYWAGYMGAALALIHWHNKQTGDDLYLDHSLTPFDSAKQLSETINGAAHSGKKPKVLLIGAKGRCGHGARDIMEQHGADVTCWGRTETEHMDRAALLNHDILINCAFIIGDVPAFLSKEDLSEEMNLSVVADVSCDPYSAFNPIPLYHETTTWDKPYIPVEDPKSHKTVDIIAIDNLPSLLPREASKEFAGLLLPYLMTLDKMDSDPVWAAARNSFNKAVKAMTNAQTTAQKNHAVR